MKILFLLISLLSLGACSSPQYQFHKTKGINTNLVAYVENFKLNNTQYGKTAQQEAFPVNFKSNLTTAGVCYLRENIKDREVLINPATWEQFPERRQYIIDYLLSACYGSNYHRSPYYEIHLTRL